MEKLYRVYKDPTGIFFVAESLGEVFLKSVNGELIGEGYTLEEAIAMKKLLGESNDTKQ